MDIVKLEKTISYPVLPESSLESIKPILGSEESLLFSKKDDQKRYLAIILTGYDPSFNNKDSFFFYSPTFEQAVSDESMNYAGLAVLDDGCVHFVSTIN